MATDDRRERSESKKRTSKRTTREERRRLLAIERPAPTYGPKMPKEASEGGLIHAAKRRAAAEKEKAASAAQRKRHEAGKKDTGPHTIGGTEVTADQYYAYKHLHGKDPEAAEIYLEAIEAHPDNPSAAESVLATIRSGTKTAKASGKAMLKEETKREQAAVEAAKPLPSLQELGFKPSQRGGSATTEWFAQHKMGGTLPTVGPGLAPVKAHGLEVSPHAIIWLGEESTWKKPGETVMAPARGHMQDPDAPGGRNVAGIREKETTKLSTINEYFNKLYDWTPLQVMQFQRAQGLTPTGEPGDATRAAWTKVLEHAARMYAAGKKVTPESLMGYNPNADKPGGGGGGPGTAGGGPKTTVGVALSNRGDAKKLLNAIFREKLGRGVTEDEVSKFQAQLNASERKSPVTKVENLNAAGAYETSNVSGGLNAEQFTEDYLMETKGGEANARMVGVDYFDAALKAIGAAV